MILYRKHTGAHENDFTADCYPEDSAVYEFVPASHRRPLTADEQSAIWRQRGGPIGPD